MSEEIQLTELIDSLLDWQETKHKNIFHYHKANFRGAFARYYYFSAMTDLSYLLPLVVASKDWAESSNNQALLNLYHQINALDRNKNKFKRWVTSFGALVKLCVLKILSYKSTNALREKKTQIQKIGFFVINARYVMFFKDIVRKLDGYEVAFFSPLRNKLDKQVRIIGAETHPLSFDSLHLHAINISKRSPLFKVYVDILQFYLKIYGGLKHSQTSVLVFAEGTSMEDEIASQAARQLSIPTIRVQSGRGGVMHSGYKNMTFTKMLCWGEGFISHYQAHSPEPVYEVTGSPFIQSLLAVEEEKEKYMPNGVAIFTQPVSKYITQQDYTALITLCRDLINQSSKPKILVRKHPVDTLTLFDDLAEQYPEEVQLMPPEAYSLQDVMRESSCAVGFYSTTLSEAAACGVIPIILKLKKEYSVFPYPENYGAAIVTTNINEALNVINDIFDKPNSFIDTKENMKSFAKSFFGEAGQDAIQNTVNSIIRTI